MKNLENASNIILFELGRVRRQKIHNETNEHFWLITKQEEVGDTQRTFKCEFCDIARTETKVKNKFKIGTRVKLTNTFGLHNGVNQFPDSAQRGKLATIIGFDGYGYDIIIDGNSKYSGEYGGIPETMFEIIK